MPKFQVGTMEEVEKLSEILPDGVYEVEVFSGQDKLSKKQETYMAWMLKVINNEDPDKNGTTLFHNTPLSGKGRIFLQQFYAGCGVAWEGDSVDLPEDLLGRTCMISVGNREYEGTKQNDIKKILPK